MKLASFDIFDTTLIRKCGESKNIFYLLAQRLYPTEEAKCKAFQVWRNSAENRTLRIVGNREVTLADIYALPDVDSFNEYSPEELATFEREVESENLIVNPAVRNLITQKRKESYQIAFISDMYLDSKFLSEILQRERCWENGDRIFVSCEQQARKDRGSLYDIVRQALHPETWEHFGDNRHSDVKIARRQGIKATWINTQFNPAELYMMSHSAYIRASNQLPILIGLSRAARITMGNDPYSILAADFVAPAYIPYVLYILQDAKRRGVKRLYFLSRDSYILMKIAQSISNNDIELRYLFVSRKALLLPYLANGGIDEYLAVNESHTIRHSYIDRLLLHLGTDRDELRALGITFDYKRANTAEQERDFLQKIFHSAFTPILQDRATEANRKLLDYFAQEKMLNDDSIAMVDVGWLGTTRLMINSILRRINKHDALFYYYGIRSDVLPPKTGDYLSYCSREMAALCGTALIEIYYSASPYPSTIDYQQIMDREITPVFAESKGQTNTLIAQKNIEIAEWVVKEIMRQNIILPESLYLWAYTSIEIITTMNIPINLYPLLQCPPCDEEVFVCKLSMIETLRIVCLGMHVTALDKASLICTFGWQISPLLWKIHCYISNIRAKLKIFYKIKNYHIIN